MSLIDSEDFYCDLGRSWFILLSVNTKELKFYLLWFRVRSQESGLKDVGIPTSCDMTSIRYNDIVRQIF
jgi:hypothetical protein